MLASLKSEDGNDFSTVVNWDQDPLTFWTRNKKHNAPNLQHRKHPYLSEEGKASKFIFGGEKFRCEAGRLVRCSLASFVALHKRRRGEERFIVMIFCCTALDTVVGINLGAVMNIMWRWTKCNSSTQESDASEYYASHVASRAMAWNCQSIFFLAEINCQISFIIAKICISMVPHHHHHITNTKGFILSTILFFENSIYLFVRFVHICYTLCTMYC